MSPAVRSAGPQRRPAAPRPRPEQWVETSRPTPAGWWVEALLIAAFAGLTAALAWLPPLLELDIVVRDWADGHRPPPVRWAVLVMDHLGQGGPLVALTVGMSFWLAWRYRTVRPIMAAGFAPILSTVLIVWLKRWTQRGAPHYGSVHLFSGAGQVEYPSGHVSNGVVYYGLLAVLLSPYLTAGVRRTLRWLPATLVFVGTTYLGYHWFTDSVGGALLGVFILRIIERIPWWTMPLPAVLDGAVRRRAERRGATRRSAARHRGG